MERKFDFLEISPSGTNNPSYLDEWFLVASTRNFIIILLTYLTFVKLVGPYLMKNRAPFDLKNVILVYNIVQVAMSGYLLQQSIGIILNNGLVPDKCMDTTEETKYEVYRLTYLYMLTKITELLDTVFFVLRKKERQASFLHVYHHSVIFFCSWAMLRYSIVVNMSMVVLGVLNSFVHVVMYSYYGLSGFPALTKYLWWKKYITKMQMIQFVLIMAFAAFEYTTGKCHFSHELFLCFLINLSFVFYLFGDFYRKTYKKEKLNTDNTRNVNSHITTNNNIHEKPNGNSLFASKITNGTKISGRRTLS